MTGTIIPLGDGVHLTDSDRPTCERLIDLGPRQCGAPASWYWNYDFIGSPSISVHGVVPGARHAGRTAICDEHRRDSAMDDCAEGHWSRIPGTEDV